jgi:molybdopterin molybdotransferase
MRWSPGWQSPFSRAFLTVAPGDRHIAPMVVALERRQRIERLTPLDDVLRRIGECVHPVIAREMRAASALGATLAQDVAVADPHPSAPLALIDGWALRAEATADAGTYAPAMLPEPREVAVGETLGWGCDAVAPLESVTWRGDKGEAHAVVLPGEGVLMPGTDASAGEVLRQTGHRLRAIDLAAIAALGIAGMRVRRPRVRIARVGGGRNDIADAVADWLAHTIAADGGEPVTLRPSSNIEALLTDGGVDAVTLVGGTGAGPRDDTVHALARTGTVEAHGIAVSPGETAAFGLANAKPVLLIPSRLDAALAVWLLIGRPMLTRLRGGSENELSRESLLTTKVASTVGLTELVLVRRVPDGIQPLASKYFPLAALAQADGWIVVPAASEGLPAGTRVRTRSLP